MYKYTHAYTLTNTHTHMLTCMHAQMYIYTHYTHTHVCTNTHTNTHSSTVPLTFPPAPECKGGGHTQFPLHYYMIYSYCNCMHTHTLKVTGIALSSCTHQDNTKDSPRPIQVMHSQQLNRTEHTIIHVMQ